MEGRDPNSYSVSTKGGLDPDVVEAASLAHDLGHPPFGHVAEEELSRLVVNHAGESSDRYEGNAQTFRILTKIDSRHDDFDGLNLTAATLSAATKYPWGFHNRKKEKKWGAYSSELDELRWSRQHLEEGLQEEQTLEAAIMDWADDIAYAIHDLEDFYKAGLIPLDRLSSIDGVERSRFLATKVATDALASREEKALLLEEFLEFTPFERPYDGSRLQRTRLRTFSSNLVSRYIRSTRIGQSASNGQALDIPKAIKVEVSLLKDLTWHYVIDSDSLVSNRHGQARIISNLFQCLIDDADKGTGELLPPFFQRQT
jgi:dGTPase